MKNKVLFLGLTPKADQFIDAKFKAKSPLFPLNQSRLKTNQDIEDFLEDLPNIILTIYDVINIVNYLRHYTPTVQSFGISMFELEMTDVDIENLVKKVETEHNDITAEFINSIKVEKVTESSLEFLNLIEEHLLYEPAQGMLSGYDYDYVIYLSRLELNFGECQTLIGGEMCTKKELSNHINRTSRFYTGASGRVSVDNLTYLFQPGQIKLIKKKNWDSIHEIDSLETIAMLSGYAWFLSYLANIECVDVVIKPSAGYVEEFDGEEKDLYYLNIHED